MGLKEQFAADLDNIFFNLEELGELQEINSREIMVVEDGEKLQEYKAQGIFRGQKLIYVRAADLPAIPRAGDALLYGRAKWQVEECREDTGLLEIILERWSR